MAATKSGPSCIPLKRLYDGPLFGTGEGTLTELKNMRIRPGGYAEARGGMERLKPSGGTPTAPIATGGITGGIELATSNAFVARKPESTYYNHAMDQGFEVIGLTGLGANVNDAMYVGSDFTFSRIAALLAIAANWNVTLVYEYWNGAWVALTTTETIDFTITATTQFASWIVPTDWVPNEPADMVSTGFYKYWMRIRMSAKVAVTTIPSMYAVSAFHPGMREIYTASSDPRTAVAAGKFMRYGQTGTTAVWNAINSSLYSGSTCPQRMATYKGRVFVVNGKDAKKFDGAYFSDIGLPKLTTNITVARSAGAGLGNAIFRYYAAWGYGPSQDLTTAQPADPQSMYGVGQATLLAVTGGADPADASSVQTIAGPNQQVTITINAAPPAGATALYIYRTRDLTSVDVTDRVKMPAFLLFSRRTTVAGSQMEGIVGYPANVIDSSLAEIYPPVNAITYDNLPPTGAKFCLVYQNRLFLGTDSRWYWSDAFKPDVYNRFVNYIDLTRANGGRNMGGVEFADQSVLFTEDQTWGLTNVDLDVPQLYPIHPAVGCICPGSVASGHGYLIWLSRDGFYVWDGSRDHPRKVSADLFQTFEKKGYETMGGGSAVVHNHRYDFWGMDPALNTPAAKGYSLDLETFTWSTLEPQGLSSTVMPLCLVNAPLGHSDFGVPHPLFAKRDVTTAAGDYHVYMGEQTTADNGTGYSCAATMHYPLPPAKVFKPNGCIAYYSTDAGWGTPALAVNGTQIGSSPGALNAGTPNSGTDYTLITGTYASQGAACSDLKVRFSVTSASGGTVGRQRFHGAELSGDPADIPRTM